MNSHTAPSLDVDFSVLGQLGADLTRSVTLREIIPESGTTAPGDLHHPRCQHREIRNKVMEDRVLPAYRALALVRWCCAERLEKELGFRAKDEARWLYAMERQLYDMDTYHWAKGALERVFGQLEKITRLAPLAPGFQELLGRRRASSTAWVEQNGDEALDLLASAVKKRVNLNILQVSGMRPPTASTLEELMAHYRVVYSPVAGTLEKVQLLHQERVRKPGRLLVWVPEALQGLGIGPLLMDALERHRVSSRVLVLPRTLEPLVGWMLRGRAAVLRDSDGAVVVETAVRLLEDDTAMTPAMALKLARIA